MIDTNLGSTFYVCQAAGRRMMRRRRGAIVTICSVVGVHGNAGQTNYAASKAGMIGLTKSLAKEIGSRGVRVNCIAPGYIATELTGVLPESAREAILSLTPLGRLGEPEDVARLRTLPGLGRCRLRHRCGSRRRRRVGDVAVAMREDGGRRVVVTGIGMVTPLGDDARGDVGRASSPAGAAAAPITIFPLRDPPVRFACEVKDFDPTVALDRKLVRRTDRFCSSCSSPRARRWRTRGSRSRPTDSASASAPPWRPASAACRRSTSPTSTCSRRASTA